MAYQYPTWEDEEGQTFVVRPDNSNKPNPYPADLICYKRDGDQVFSFSLTEADLTVLRNHLTAVLSRMPY